MGLGIRRIDKAQDFVALAPLWSRLVNDSGQTSPFFSHDWFWCCWHGVWPQRHPEILVVEDNGTPIAIIPLMHWRARVHGLPIRYVSFLECPQTPMVDLLAVSQHDRVIDIFLQYLIGRSDWDVVWLQKLPSASPTVKTLENLLPGRLPWRRAGELRCPSLAIDGDWKRFCQAMNGPLTDIRQHMYAQLQRAGDIRVEEHRSVDLQSSLLQESIAVMNLLPYRGHVIATMPRQREFFRVLTQRAGKNGWLSLWTLKLDGHIIAIEYQLRSHGRVQVLVAGEDPAHRALSPWPTLNLAILQTHFLQGCDYEYSIGPGVMEDRLWWVNGGHAAVHLKLYRPGPYRRVLAQIEGEGVSESSSYALDSG